MKRIAITAVSLFIFISIIYISIFQLRNSKLFPDLNLKNLLSLNTVRVPNDYSTIDRNNNNTPDAIDVVQEARKEAERQTPYKDAYYANGYPPDSEGVCTDVVWRAFKGININLKEMIDKDIKQNTALYKRVEGKPDPNIDFRRVPNLDIFFKRYAETLTTELKPGDVENLRQWQPGDIIVILQPYQHVGIISDKRSKDGVPYLIHNTYPHAEEVSHFNFSGIQIGGHYRWKY